MASTRSEDGATNSALTKKGVKKVMRYQVKTYQPRKQPKTGKPRPVRRYPLNPQAS